MGGGIASERIGGELLMADYLTTDTELASVANAIRTKGGTSAQLVYPTGFVSAIEAIPTGGGSNRVLVCENTTMQRYGEGQGRYCTGVPFEFELGTYEFDMLASGFEDAEGNAILNLGRYDEHDNPSDIFEFVFTVTVSEDTPGYIEVSFPSITSDMTNTLSEERQYYYVLGSVAVNVGSSFGAMPYAVGLDNFTIDAVFYDYGTDAFDYSYIAPGQQMTCVSLYATKL